MPNRNLTLLPFLFTLLLGFGCKEPLQETDRFPMRTFPIDSLLEHLPRTEAILEKVDRQKAAFHPDSVAMGHWVARLEDPADLDGIRIHFQDRLGFYHHPGNWAMRQAFFKSDLRSYSIPRRRESIVSLRNEASIMKEKADAELMASVYYLFRDEATADVAMEAAAILDPEHGTDSILHFLKTNYLLPERYINALGALGLTPPESRTVAYLREAMDRMKGHHTPDADWLVKVSLNSLLQLHEKADSLLRREIEGLIMDCIATRPVEGNKILRILIALSESDPLPGYLPLFEAQMGHPDRQNIALIGIAKIKGASAQNLIWSYLKDEYVRYHDPDVVPDAFADNPMAALPLLLKGFLDTDNLVDQRGWLNAVWETGGKPLADAFVAQIPDARQREKLRKDFHLRFEPIGADHPLHQLERRLLQAGLVTDPIAPAVLDSIQLEMRPYVDPYFEDALWDHLHILARIEAPDSDFPHRYLMNAGNAFLLGAQQRLDDLEIYPGERTDAQGTEMDMLWLIFQGRAYFVEAPARNYELQLEAASHAFNLVLADAGYSERFFRVPETTDAKHRFLFAEPARARAAIQTLGLW